MNQRFFIIWILTFAVANLFAQQGNPFEIVRTGSDSVEVADQEVQQTTGFEVLRSDDSLYVSPEPLDTTEFESEADTIDTQALTTNDANPFEVSHVPYRKSELKGQTKASQAKERSTSLIAQNAGQSSNTFLFWFTLFSLLLLAIVMNVQRSAVGRIFRSISNENILKLSKREEKNGTTGHFLMLYVIYFINMATLVYLVLDRYSNISGMYYWSLILGALVLIYLVRHTAMSALGYIFAISKDTSLYSFTILSFNLALGLILIPINLIIAYSPDNISSAFIYIALGIAILLLVIRVFRGVLLAANYIGNNLFQFFIYLCGFEIAPVLVLLTIAKNII